MTDSETVPEHLQSDDVARRTEWDSLQPKSGANYRTRAARRTGDRVAFEPTGMSRIIVGFVFLFGAISLVIGSVVTYMWLSGRAANMNGDTIVLKIAGPAFLVGAVLSIAGGVFLKHLLFKPIVFDQGVGRYWRGPNPQNERSVALKSIYALQIIGKWVTQTGPDTGGYASYELNAVTSDAERHNVVDHGDIGGLQDDAELLAKFLDVPVWDTTLD